MTLKTVMQTDWIVREWRRDLNMFAHALAFLSLPTSGIMAGELWTEVCRGLGSHEGFAEMVRRSHESGFARALRESGLR